MQPLRIAHAGGGLPGRIYNNSKEAIDANYMLGFRWFELDFIWRDDGVLTTDGGRAASVASPTASYYDAKDEDKAKGLALDASSSMTLATLTETLREYPDIYIVSDVKEDNLAALATIAEAIPDAASRIICQIFSPQEYEPVRALGFQNVTWTLYKYSGNDDDVLRQILKMDLMAVTMPIARAEAGLAHEISALGVATYAHTVNDHEQLRDLQTLYGVSEVFSDFLAPSRQDEDTLSWSSSSPSESISSSPDSLLNVDLSSEPHEI